MGNNLMKKLVLALALSVISASAFAGPNDFIFTQRNALDNGNVQRVIVSPATTGFFTYNATTKLGGYTTLGDGLTLTNGVLSASVVPGPTGATGPAGPAGTNGTNGAPGETGATGATGATGPAGTTNWAGITNRPTTLAGFGITDAYPLASNPAGYLTSISGAQVTAALGLTPVSQSGARAAIGLTTTGTGAATYNATTGILNVPTPASVTVPTINRVIATTATDGTYVWTLPVACTAGQLPVVSLTPENGSVNEIINHKITAKTNASVTIAVSRALVTLNGLLGLNIPVVQTSPGATTVHLIAVCP